MLWWLVQIVVYSGKRAGAQAHASHEPQTFRGLAQGKHQRGLLWQVLRFCGGKKRNRFRRGAPAACGLTCTRVPLGSTRALSLASLADGAGSGRKLLPSSAGSSARLTTHGMSQAGMQLSGAFEKVLLWWRWRGSRCLGVSQETLKAWKSKERQEKLAPNERPPLHLSSSPRSRQTQAPVAASLQPHVCYIHKRASSAELHKVSCGLCDTARPDMSFTPSW